MSAPTVQQDRYFADFRRNRAYAAGVLIGNAIAELTCSRASAANAPYFDGHAARFAANTVRTTDRGLYVEPAQTELLTNSSMQPDTGSNSPLPYGWNSDIGTLTLISSDLSAAEPWVKVRLDYAAGNTSSIVVSLNLEQGYGLSFGSGTSGDPFAGNVYAFGGKLQIDNPVNATLISVRLTGRTSGHALVGDDGRYIINAVSSPQAFNVSPMLDSTAVTIMPRITMTVPANSPAASVELTLFAPGLVAGTKRGTFISTTPPTSSFTDFYPNPTLSGAVVGNPGTLPSGWAQGTGITTRVTALTSDTTYGPGVTTAVTVASGATGTLRLTPFSGAGAIAATPGQVWVAKVYFGAFTDPNGLAPKLRLVARNSSGTSLQSATANAVSGSQASTFLTCPANTAYVSVEISFTPPASGSTAITLDIHEPLALLRTAVAGSGPVTRYDDVVSATNLSRYALPFSAIIECEHRDQNGGQTLATFVFGTTRLRLLTGDRIGAMWETFDGSAWNVAQDLTQPSLFVAGTYRIALAIKSTGTALIAAVGFPDEADGGSIESSGIAVTGYAQPSAVYFGSSGDSARGLLTGNTALRFVQVKSAYLPVDNLELLTRKTWAPRSFAQPTGLTVGPNLEDVPGFVVPTVAATGTTFQYDGTMAHKYMSASNGGQPMFHTIVDPSIVPFSDSVPYYLFILNNDPSSALTLTANAGDIGTMDAAGNPTTPVRSIMIPAGKYICIGTNDGAHWVYAMRDISAVGHPAQTVTLLSIYGPSDPSDPFRSVIYMPWFVDYHVVIDPIRQLSSYSVTHANNYATTGDLYEAALVLRAQRDACSSDYWSLNGNDSAANTQATQVISCASAYKQVADSRVGSPAEHAVIRGWFDRRVTQTNAYYQARLDAGLADVNQLSEQQNHYYSGGCAAALCAMLLDRGDCYDFALNCFKVAMADVMVPPAYTGAFPNELVRGAKSLQYQCLASQWIVTIAEALVHYGFDAYDYMGGVLRQVVNFTAFAIDSPSNITSEQSRLAGFNLTGLNAPMVPTVQIGIGTGGTDPSTGEQLPNESKTAWLYLPYRRLTNAQAPWRSTWTSRFASFDNIYSTSIGGSQAALYPYTSLQLVAPLPSHILDLSHWTLGLPVNSSGELFYNTFQDDGGGNLVPNPSGNAARSTSVTKSSLSTFTGPYFYSTIAGDGASEVNLVAPIFGSTTTPTTLSNHTRSELRGTIHGSGASSTEFRRNNQPRLEITTVVKKRPAANGDIDICQIHGLNTFFLIVVLRANGNLESSMTPPNGTGRTAVNIATGVSVGDIISLVMDWDTDDKIRYTVSINGGAAQNYVHATDPGWANLDCYFKAGAYHNSNPQDSQDFSHVVNGLLNPSQVTDVAWVAIRSLRQSLRAP